jgi:hypothetical protein
MVTHITLLILCLPHEVVAYAVDADGVREPHAHCCRRKEPCMTEIREVVLRNVLRAQKIRSVIIRTTALYSEHGLQ